MIYLPDTNCFSAYFSNQSLTLSARLNQEMAAGRLVLSVMVLAELEFGAFKAREVFGTKRYVDAVARLKQCLPPEPIDESFALHYAQTRLYLELQGNKIGDRDLIIASHSLAIGASVITRNMREFQRVPGLNVENWQMEG